MNKKKYISVGFFIVLIVIGAGIAYYFDAGTINDVLGIAPAQVADISDADPSLADLASSSAEDIFPQESAPVASVLPKKVAPAKKSVANNAPSAQTTASSGISSQDDDDNEAIAPTAASEASSSEENSDQPLAQASPCSFPGNGSSTTRTIIFNEVAWMGSVSSSIAEWIEVKNISTSTIDLSGWKLENASGKVTVDLSTGGTIAPEGLFLLSRGSGSGEIYSGDLVNGGDVLALVDPQCDVSDYLDASHGWPAGNNTTKQTMERDADGVGWHTSASPGGTPDAENSAGVPLTQYSLTITLEGSAAGANITSIPAGLVCAATCTGSYASGTQVSLMPVPGANSSFSGWSGGCSGATGCSLVISAATSLTASFRSTAPASSAPPPSTDIPVPQPSATSTTVDNATSTNVADAGVSGGNILIAAVQIAGTASDNDLVRLFNPTSAAVDMSGWKLHKRSETGADYSLKSFPEGSIIGAGQSFTWANSEDGFSETIGANVSSTETLSVNNSVALLDAAGNVIDAVAWGTGTGQYGEGPPYPTSPAANQILSRRSSDGVMVDTDNNTNDFDLQ